MHRFKGTLIAFIIFVILLGSLFLFDTEKRVEKKAEKVFPDIQPEEILSIRLNYPSSEALLEKKEDGGWMLTTDSGEYKADKGVVRDLVQDITGMEVESAIPEGETQPEEYGFVKSETEFTVTTGDTDYPVIIGDKSPVGSGTYIYDLGDGRVLIVNDRYLEALLNKSPFDFREAGLVDMAGDKVDKIVTRVGEFRVELEKENGKWVGVDTSEQKALDQRVIDDLIKSFSELEAEGFENDSPDDLSEYGLIDPTAEIVLYEGNRGVVILFGKRKDETTYYLKIASGDPVYSVSKDYFKMLPKNIDQISER